MLAPVSTRTIELSAATAHRSPLALSLSGEATNVTVRVERGVSAVIFDTTESSVHSIHIELSEASALSYVSCSRGSSRRCTSVLGAGASMHWHCVTLGDCRPHSLRSTLQGSDAVSNIDWIFSVRGKERQELSVHNVFGAPHGGGEITLKGVAEDAAFATVNGMIEITERGKGTDTYLTEDVLMLDPTAKIDAVPGLEIRTNDVKASHSATVSRVTAEDLFYFRSRGIDAATARDMYVDGFLGDLLARIKHDDLRETLRKKLSDGRRRTL